MTRSEARLAHADAWARPAPDAAALRADTGLAILLAFSATLTSLLYQRIGLFENPAPPWVWALGLGLCTLPLALRRRYPVPVALLAAIGFYICGEYTVPEVLITNIGLFIALYTVGAWEPRRALAFWARFGIAGSMILWLVVSLVISSSSEDAFPGVSRSGIFSAYATFAVIQIVTNLLYFGGAFYFGERSWRAARMQARLEAQGHELELERQTGAAQAVALDRIAIARELHDVVAHHVSVMGIQAAAARRSIDRDPAGASRALEVVEESAHSAVTELRRLVHTLRTPEADDAATTVGIAQLQTLVGESQGAGTPTTLIVVGTPTPLPMLVDVALYRVVQEALTNVRKHAGRGAEASVRLRFEPGAVEVEVSDDGVRATLGKDLATLAPAVDTVPALDPAPIPVPAAGPASPSRSGIPGAHLGLRGMRERIGAVGGDVQAGRRESGGFMVRARVPLAERSGA